MDNVLVILIGMAKAVNARNGSNNNDVTSGKK
jgi:hypothetical protein